MRQRLANVANTQGRPFSEVLQYYALERWLFRLSQSMHSDRFVLKGALLFVVWKTPATRPTRDIDLLGRLSNDLEAIGAVMNEVCQVRVDDGLSFDSAGVKTERIAGQADYHGVRATFQAKLGNARIPMCVDIGFSDVVTPAPITISYPTILDLPEAKLLAYNRETVIAEKLEAMVKLGELNSRMKDFFDISLLATSFEFDGAILAAAIRATFNHRQTVIQSNPHCFSADFRADKKKWTQWKAFARRSMLASESEFPQVVARVRDFLQPIIERLANQELFDRHWNPGGPWQ